MEDMKLFERIRKNKSKNIDKTKKSEIYTGECYQANEVQSFLRKSEYNFTMSYGTDGVSVYESSPYSIWPIFCTINELDFDEKSYFLSLSTLWHGTSKPNPNAFLVPFVKESQRLYDEGFKWKDVNGIVRTSRVMFLLCTADAPARSMLANMTQHNGEYGCGLCFNPGIRVRKGDGTAQAFDNVPCAFRDKESFTQAAGLAIETGKAILGVKGPSKVNLVPRFDISKAFIPDYMHSVLLGIVKQFIIMWKSDCTSLYYIQNFEECIDKVLLKVCPTDEILRNYRSMAKYGRDWKASEFRNFLLFYSPLALFHLLPTAHYKHWMLLVKSFWLLLGKNISNENINISRRLLSQFASETKKLYGLKSMSYNLHLLTHVSDFVRDWGSPWAYSAFLYENAGGFIKQLFHGSKHISVQMFQHFIARGKLRIFSRKYISDDAPIVSELYNRLDSPLRPYANLNGTQLFGRVEILNISERIFLAIQLEITSIINRTCYGFTSFQRLKFKGRTYSTARYCEGFKRNNSVVQLLTGPSEIYTIFDIFEVSRECICQAENTACNVPMRQLFPNGKIFFVGNKINLLSPSSSGPIVRETFVDGKDIIGFMRQINPREKRLITRAFTPDKIAHKAIVIQDDKKNDFCVINKIRFEMD